MFADIITIGDEILIGQIVDTNSSWIAKSLNKTGISVHEMISIQDNKEHIIKTLDKSFSNVDLILVTGGIGPTKDDITKQTLAEYFETSLEFNQEVFDHIERLLKSRNSRMNELNRGQAMVPGKCKIIPNSCGTAPGMWFTKNKKVLISLPGVPFEMIKMMEELVLSEIKTYFKTQELLHKTLLITGITESDLALQISRWEDALPQHMKLAYLPSPGIIRLRLSAVGNLLDSLKDEIQLQIKKLRPILQEKILAEDDVTIQEVIGKLFIDNKIQLSVSESCTGGNIAHLLTLMPGSSVYFKGGVVAYANEIKESVLEVSKDILTQFGAVSQEVVEAMAIHTAKKFGTDYAIGISGIAGPDGGSADKPVGTVWIAVYNGKIVTTAKFIFGDNRERNITRASIAALNMLRIRVLNDLNLV